MAIGIRKSHCSGVNPAQIGRFTKGLCLVLAVALFSGCATTPYKYGTGRGDLDAGKFPKTQQQFLHGKPNRFLDASDWIWPGSLLAKLILWNKEVDSHQISPETVAALEKYLQDNQLHDVQVLVNNYRPGNQWQRLFKNKSISGGWRYTLGILSVVGYTITPGRFFGGDAFNPYTNTVYLYSDDPAIALHEGGHAKDFASRQNKGNYAAIYQIPFVPLYHEYQATSDTLSYLQDQEQTEQQADAYVTLYPAYSTYITSPFILFGQQAPVGGLILQTFGTIPAHITGRVKASRLRSKNAKQTDLTAKQEPADHAGHEANNENVLDSSAIGNSDSKQ